MAALSLLVQNAPKASTAGVGLLSTWSDPTPLNNLLSIKTIRRYFTSSNSITNRKCELGGITSSTAFAPNPKWGGTKSMRVPPGST
jgi:hypothetical protein